MNKKTSILLVALTFMLNVVTACGDSGNKSENKEVKGPEVEVVNSYLQLKEALVAADAAKAKQTALTLAEKANALTDEAIKIEISTTATAIANAADIAAQRVQLDKLTEAVYNLAKSTETGIDLYYQHCPMANEGAGGYWLSASKEIENPYYGSKMMKCGSVKEEL